jgi:hypothetical protein
VCDFGTKRLDEEFDGAATGDAKTGSWNQASMLARWPLTIGTSGGTFTSGKGLTAAPGAAMNTNKTSYRMTSSLNLNKTATYGEGNDGIGPYATFNGTDTQPIVLQFAVDFNGESFGSRSNFYMELSYDDGTGDDPAPRNGMITEDTDTTNGDQGPWTDQVVHRSIAFGSFAAINVSSSAPDDAGTKGACMYYNGTRWFYTKMITDLNGQSANLWKRQDGGTSLFKLTIKSQTVVLECDNQGGYPTTNTAHEIPRVYTGPFNRVSMVMGNTLVAGKVNYVDEIEIRDGVVSRPLFIDYDQDGDVDQEDFGHLQKCLTGDGVTVAANCAACDIDGDQDADDVDVERFMPCLTGPGLLANVSCLD